MRVTFKLHQLRPPRQSIIYLLAFLLFLNYSCKKSIKENEEVKADNKTVTSFQQRDVFENSCVEQMENDLDTTDVPTVLGSQLQGNPYSVAVMQQASINLYGNANGIAVNKLYVKFRPANVNQLLALEALDLELYDYPLDYEILHQGDYYPQAGIGPDEIPWYYAVVDAGFQLPGDIQYELIQQIYVPTTNLYLEKEAFRITGNPFEDSCGIVPNLLTPPCEIDPCGQHATRRVVAVAVVVAVVVEV